jgi:inositol transport system permease protein
VTDLTSAAPGKFDAFSFLARFAPLIFLLLLMAVFATLEPRFLSSARSRSSDCWRSA